MRQFHGLAGAERLRRDGLNAGSLELGQRRLENLLHTPKCSTSRRMVRPRRGVRARANPCKARRSPGLGTKARASGISSPPPRLIRGPYTSAKNDVKVTRHMALLKSTIGRMKRLRISAISYLNTAPLMWDFEHGDAGTAFDISYTVPAQCAADLARGSADIGIIPAAAYASIPGLAILPGVAIASRRPVRSILLVSQVPLDQIRSVALDTSSLTSVALTKVLFAKWWGQGRSFTPMAPDIERMMAAHDAGLVIGDPALKVD